MPFSTKLRTALPPFQSVKKFGSSPLCWFWSPAALIVSMPLPASDRTRRVVRVEVVRERALLQDPPHAVRLHAARPAGRLQHQGADGRRVRRRGAGAEEVRQRVLVLEGVLEEECRVAAVHRGEVRLLADVRLVEPAVVPVEVDGRRSRRGEVLGDERPEERIGRDADRPARRVVAVGHGTQVAEVLLRAHAAEADVADAVRDVAVVLRRRVRARDHELQRRARQPAGFERPVREQVLLGVVADERAVLQEEQQVVVGQHLLGDLDLRDPVQEVAELVLGEAVDEQEVRARSPATRASATPGSSCCRRTG